MNIPDVSEVNEKIRRIRAYFDQSGYEAMIIGRQDNFAWLTCGGNNRVVITSEEGFSLLVVTGDSTFVVAQVMDGPRVQEEELNGLGFQSEFLHWFEESRVDKAALLVKGKKTISDIPVTGADCLPGVIQGLHYPLTEQEIDKCKRLGKITEGIIRKIADGIKPGLSEHDVEAMFAYEYARLNITPEVLLVGSDERIAKFRHPNPSNKKIEKLVLLHPGVKKWGLHANVTRMVCLGDALDAELARKYAAVSLIEAAVMSMCAPGETYSNILSTQKMLYAQTGYPDEWRNHYPGAVTGYILANASLSLDPTAKIGPNQAFDWFVTITGVKVEELSMNTASGMEIPSVTGAWPTKPHSWNSKTFLLPEILMK